MTGNCGFPEGQMHSHVERCYQAGYADGRAAALEDVRVLLGSALRALAPAVVRIADAARRLGVIQ